MHFMQLLYDWDLQLSTSSALLWLPGRLQDLVLSRLIVELLAAAI